MSADAITLQGAELSREAGAEVTAARPGKRARRARLVGRYVLLTVLAFVVMFPIYITVVNSLLLPRQIADTPPTFFPTSPQWHTYADAWTDGHLARYLANSFVVTVFIVAGQLIIATLAGYAFAFLRFPFRRTLFVLFLATLMVPFEITIITNLSTVNSLGWYDSYQGLIVPLLATGALGFGAFLMRQAFLQVPKDLHDAAKLDGYGHLRFLTRVAVPLVRPMLAALPLVVLLLIFQKQLVRGLTAGAVKG